MKPIARWKPFGQELWRELKKDRLANSAAALAFYMVLALFPAAIFGLSLLPYLPIPHLQQAILELVSQALPGLAAELLTGTVKEVLAQRSGGLLSFGFLFAVWSASTGMHAVMQQLNVVYGVTEGRSFLRARAMAALLTVLFFVLVVGALALVVFGGMAQAYLGDRFGWSTGLRVFFATLRWLIIVFALHLGLSLVYQLAPNLKHRFVLLSGGNLFATAALLLASVGFKLYVANFANYQAVYGGLGGIIVLLLWLYVAGWVILLGGEINDVSDRLGTDGRVVERSARGRGPVDSQAVSAASLQPQSRPH